MDAVKQPRYVHSGLIPEVLSIKRDYQQINLQLKNFGANRVELSFGSDFTGPPIPDALISSASGVVDVEIPTPSHLYSAKEILIRLCDVPDNETTFGERLCSAYKKIDLSPASVATAFSGAALEPEKIDPSKCASGSVLFADEGCQPDTLIASATYDKSGDIFLRTRDGGALPIVKTKNIASTEPPSPLIQMLTL